MTPPEQPLTPDQALYFRDQFRRARAMALRDAEAWHGVIVALEQLREVVAPGQKLFQAAAAIGLVAENSALATLIPNRHRELHTPFPELFHLVRRARNAALHEGAYARRLTRHAIELSLVSAARDRRWAVESPVRPRNRPIYSDRQSRW